MRLGRWTSWFALMVTIGFGLSFLGRWHFMLDNLSSFRVHFAITFFLCAAIFFAIRAWRWSGVAMLGFLASLASIVPWYLPGVPGAVAAGTDSIRLMAANVSPRLEDPGRLLELIDRERPDVIGLIELNPGFLARLDGLSNVYPYRFEAPAEGFWGLALFSRRPLSGVRLIRFGDGVPPALVAELREGGAVVELILAHPFPPMTAELASLRNLQLQEIATHVAGSERPTILMGDLNIALWSPYYRDFVGKSGLGNARRGMGVAGTWPPNSLLGVPIDHLLHSDGITATSFRVLDPIGSDHLPVMADLAIPNHGPATP